MLVLLVLLASPPVLSENRAAPSKVGSNTKIRSGNGAMGFGSPNQNVFFFNASVF